MTPEDVGTRKGFYSPTQLTSEAKEELEWWLQVLGLGLFRRDQVLDTTVAGIQIGDGSGTGQGEPSIFITMERRQKTPRHGWGPG